jgi:hypothetical protein
LLIDFPTMKFSWLLVSLIILFGTFIGLILGFSMRSLAGISVGLLGGTAWILFSLSFVFLIRYLLRHKDYLWTAHAAQLIKKRLEIVRFLLQVLFMNPYAHNRAKLTETIDCKKMK